MNNFSGIDPDAMEIARSLVVALEADGRLRSACDLLRHAESVEDEVEEVRRRAGRGMEVVHADTETSADTLIRGGASDALWMGGAR